MKNRRMLTAIALLLLIWLPVQAFAGDGLYQVSTLQALMQGDYYGAVSVGELLTHGDTGLGTFDDLDGEMIVLDGVAYKAAYDGSILEAAAEELSPFANVAGLGETEAVASSYEGGYEGLLTALSALVPEQNLPVVFRVAGVFTGVTVRSVPKQQEPYAKLADVVQNQSVFTREQVSGVIVGFRFPQYFGDINTTGYHLHFLSDDHRFGGHLLDAATGEITVQAATLHDVSMMLPDSVSLYSLTATTDAEIAAVESH